MPRDYEPEGDPARRRHRKRPSRIDAVQKADSGHPGTPMGLADIAIELWTRHLRYDPRDPQWAGRDRFVPSVRRARRCSSTRCCTCPATTCRSRSSRTSASGIRRRPATPSRAHPWRRGDDRPAPAKASASRDRDGARRGPHRGALRRAGERGTRILLLRLRRRPDGRGPAPKRRACAEHPRPLEPHRRLGRQPDARIEGETELAFTEDVGCARYEAYGWYVQRIDGHNRAEIHLALDKAAAPSRRARRSSSRARTSRTARRTRTTPPGRTGAALREGRGRGDEEEHRLGPGREFFYVPGCGLRPSSRSARRTTQKDREDWTRRAWRRGGRRI